MGRAEGERKLALALTLAPLIRILSLALPLARFPQAAWYPLVALPLLLAFSAGLASVLIAIGLAVVYAKGMAGARWSDSRIWKALPLLSAVALVVLGILLCRDSLNLPMPG